MKRETWKRTGARGMVIATVFAVISGAVFQRPAQAATPAEVDASIKRAVEYLYSRQRNGNWEVSQTKTLGPHGIESQWGGLTAIATYALLAAGESPQDKRIQDAVQFLMKADIGGVYALGMRAQVWNFLPRTNEVREAIKRDAQLLFLAMKTKGLARGKYDYINNTLPRFDHSVSQYGVLGMWAVAQAGIEVPSDYWKQVEEGWIAHQQRNGGWCYYEKPKIGTDVTPSMTAAGVATLFITQEYRNFDAGVNCTGNIVNQHIERGLKWISDNYKDVRKNKALYTMYGIERIGVASGYKYFGQVDWYAEGADWLLKQQNKTNGSWGNGDDVVPDTCFGILFLTRGRAPVMANKLNYEVAAPGGKTREANWNQRPRDIANVTRWMGRQLERDLNWQVVTLKVDPLELLDAPILYMSGNEAIVLSAEHEQKLRTFIEHGGLILGHADCADKKFADSFRKLGEKITGNQYEFRELPDDHPIYKQQFSRTQWKNKPSVLGLSNGARELMVLLPNSDNGRFWQTQAVGGREEMWQLMANLFLYTVDTRNLRTKGETFVVHPLPNPPATSKKLTVVRGEYTGNWNPEPGGWRRLATILKNNGTLDLTVMTAKLTSADLTGANVLHLTGTQPVKFDEATRTAIREFVEKGGTLVIDSAGGASAFSSSIETELDAIFGEPAKDLRRPLKADHALYSAAGRKMGETRYRQFARSILVGDMKSPRLRGLEIDGRLAVVYSPEDLSVGLVGQAVDGIVGYEPASAVELMSNILLYAQAGGKAAKP